MRLKKDNARAAPRALVDALAATIEVEPQQSEVKTRNA